METFHNLIGKLVVGLVATGGLMPLNHTIQICIITMIKCMLSHPCKAATAPKRHLSPTITAASHSNTPLEFGNPPLPTKKQPVSGSSSIT